MSAAATTTPTPRIRRVLDTPRGHRFARPGARTPTRQELVLAQMRGNPRIEHRLRRGELPEWMRVASRRGPWRPEPGSAVPSVPRPRTAPDDAPTPGQRPPPRPRPTRPPLRRGPRWSDDPSHLDYPRRPASHRKPRRRTGWALAGYALAATAGTLGHHLTGLLG